jgi:hypothetical protein
MHRLAAVGALPWVSLALSTRYSISQHKGRNIDEFYDLVDRTIGFGGVFDFPPTAAPPPR